MSMSMSMSMTDRQRKSLPLANKRGLYFSRVAPGACRSHGATFLLAFDKLSLLLITWVEVIVGVLYQLTTHPSWPCAPRDSIAFFVASGPAGRIILPKGLSTRRLSTCPVAISLD